ncbi:MAG: sugar phosphate isomerase/epimerase family protein [Thermoplasmata archaeon]
MLGISCPPLCYFQVEKVIGKIAENFRLWEIVAEHQHHPSKALQSLKLHLPSYSLKMQVHAPLSDINIASISEAVRKASIAEIKEAILFARQIDAPVVTIHPGHKSPMTAEHEEIVYALTSEATREIAEYGEEMGVKIAVENMPEMNNVICKSPHTLLQIVKDSGAGICFDIGHANTTGNIEEFFELKELFLNVHFHDNNGKEDSHSTVGEGTIKFKKLCNRFGRYKGNIIIEARSIESAVKSKRILASMGY